MASRPVPAASRANWCSLSERTAIRPRVSTYQATALAQSATLITVMNRSGPGTSVVGAGVNSGWITEGDRLGVKVFPTF